MNIVFIVKGTSQNKRKTSKVVSSIKASGIFQEVETWYTEYAGESIRFAKQACGKFDYLIAVGGDGTLNEMVNGCLQVKDKNPQVSMPIMGVLPQGTANDFVKTMAALGTAEELLELIKSKSHREIDVGKIRCRGENGQMENRYFLNIASLGIGANVVQSVNKSKKYLGANLTFLMAIVRTFLCYKPRILNVKSSNGFEWQGKTIILAVANGRYFGSGICIAPHAKLDDGKFGITLIGDVSVKDFILKFWQLKQGVIIDHAEVIYHEAAFMEVNSETPDCAIEADGEFLGYAPLQVEILPRKISFLMPL